MKECAERVERVKKAIAAVFTPCENDEDVKVLADSLGNLVQYYSGLASSTLKAYGEVRTEVPVTDNSSKAEVDAKQETGVQAKVTENATVPEPKGEEHVRKFQGVAQIMEITAEVRKNLGLRLTKYVKKDGTESKCYIFKGAEQKSTKVLHDLLAQKAFAAIAHYKGWADGYMINEKDVNEFVKLSGVNITKVS